MFNVFGKESQDTNALYAHNLHCADCFCKTVFVLSFCCLLFAIVKFLFVFTVPMTNRVPVLFSSYHGQYIRNVYFESETLHV